MLQIFMLSKEGPQGGGASMVATQLYGLLQGIEDIHPEHLTGEANPPEPRKSIRDGMIQDLTFRASRFVSRQIGLSDFLNISHIDRRKAALRPNLYHLHDISGVLSPRTVHKLSTIAPVVWTFHDCSPFTGGCIYPLDCQTYQTECGNCPQLSRWPLLTHFDHTSLMRHWKHLIINRYVSAIICPSHWIANEVKKSGIDPELIHVIPNAVNTTLFRPMNKAAIRLELGLPKSEFMVFLGSVTFSNPYKGIQQALHALSTFGERLHVLVVGNQTKLLDMPNGSTLHFRDFTSDRSMLAKYYAACDVSLLPSLADNFPLMLLESMSCGTPAVAFATGGIPEVIEHNVNGWLAPTGDTQGLITGMNHALTSVSIRQRWVENARTTVMAHYTEDKFLRSHIALYKKLVLERQAA